MLWSLPTFFSLTVCCSTQGGMQPRYEQEGKIPCKGAGVGWGSGYREVVPRQHPALEMLGIDERLGRMKLHLPLAALLGAGKHLGRERVLDL